MMSNIDDFRHATKIMLLIFSHFIAFIFGIAAPRISELLFECRLHEGVCMIDEVMDNINNMSWGL